MDIKLTQPIAPEDIAAYCASHDGATRDSIIEAAVEKFDGQLRLDLLSVKEGSTFRHMLTDDIEDVPPRDRGRTMKLREQVDALLTDFLNYKFQLPVPGQSEDFNTDEVRHALVVTHHEEFTRILGKESQATTFMSTALSSAETVIEEALGQNTHMNSIDELATNTIGPHGGGRPPRR